MFQALLKKDYGTKAKRRCLANFLSVSVANDTSSRSRVLSVGALTKLGGSLSTGKKAFI